MNMRSQFQIKPTPKPSFTPGKNGWLQRKCACGNAANLTGKCSECENKRLSLQRHSTNQTEPDEIPPIVHEVLGKPENSHEQQPNIIAETVGGKGRSTQAVIEDNKAGLLVQKQDAGTNSSVPWTKDLLNIILSDDTECFGVADPVEQSPYSDCNSPYKPLCRSIRVPFTVEFIVDRANAPHPQPSTPMMVRVRFYFIPTDKPSKIIHDKSDSHPTYIAPNEPLKPSFGQNFPVEIRTDGVVAVFLELRDPSSGQLVIYQDRIRFVVLCV